MFCKLHQERHHFLIGRKHFILEGLKRIRFMTSHPKDLSDELIEVMKNSQKICRHLHLPVQSGSRKTVHARFQGAGRRLSGVPQQRGALCTSCQ